MSKVLTDKEVLEIIAEAIKGDAIDCGDQYMAFLEDLGKLVADHFGGEMVSVSEPDGPDGLGHCLHFKWNECVPDGGGVYAKYDTDVSVEDWKGDFAIQEDKAAEAYYEKR